MEDNEGAPPADETNDFFVSLLVLAVRGLLLWVVVPLSILVWIFVFIPLRRRGVYLGQFIGWVDYNMTIWLQRSIFRPLTRVRLPYIPVRDMPSVTHRISLLDPY